MTTDEGDLHIVSYSTREDLLSGSLATIASEPGIAMIDLDPSRFKFSRFRYPPRVEFNERGLGVVV